MFKQTVSHFKIHFLRKEILIHLIKTIENKLPGWWWSISQKPSIITISLGPGSNGPYHIDKLFLGTIKGDRGYINPYFYSGLKDEGDLLTWFDSILRQINKDREEIYKEHPYVNRRKLTSTHRFQSNRDLKELNNRYQYFLDTILDIEKQHYLLKEIYLGSCDISVDCSLRGIDPNKKKFDFTNDLNDRNCNIAHSLNWSLLDIQARFTHPIRKVG